MTDTKPSNPKDLVGSGKLPIHLWPATATALGSLGLLDGMMKYGRSNFRAVGVRASIYFDAANRHLNAWFEGENADPDSGLPHLAHALACLAIIVDAEAAGKLTDDRMHPGGYRKLLTELTPHVARLKDMHAGKSPKHYTIDTKAEGNA
ncbi:dATP/dGTP diphosphohydrolase domain-containing protein [Pseudomonas paeninsulae]|uniref:dATP/dGTP diphosphohydrolase domain-containing protein n=1 Tax=Pseudomonas paeninsulae TaxID=3110772 RepID=UPI002D796FBA|nr:dATP/dGTP diphosphohydrolase domain-containing protein [Pseudomonas sp. IT1137]